MARKPRGGTIRPSPRIAWRPDPRDGLTVWAQWVGAPATYALHWGDGAVEHPNPGAPVRHTYPEPGAYTISAGPAGGAIAFRDTVFVRTHTTPQVALAASGDNPNIWELEFNEPEYRLISWYRVDWGDGTAPQEVAGPQGARVAHGYRDSTYTVTIRDLAAQRWMQDDITVTAPAQDPDFAFTYPDPARPRTVRATCAGLRPGKTARLDWGDGTTTRPEFTATGQVADHTYPTDGTRIVQGFYADGTGGGAAWDVTVPARQRLTKPAPHIAVTVDTINDKAVWAVYVGSATDYTLHWGDGTTTRRLWWQGPVKHAYTEYGRYLVRGVNDDGAQQSAWVELAPPPPPSTGPEIHGGELAVALRWNQSTRPGSWRVTWPDWEPETLLPTPGEWVTRPALPGRRPVTATHVSSGDTSTTRVDVTDREFYCDFTLDLSGRTVSVRRTAPDTVPGWRWDVFWGDEWDDPVTGPEQLPESGWASHTYTTPGLYFIEIGSQPEPGVGAVYYRVKQVTIT